MSSRDEDIAAMLSEIVTDREAADMTAVITGRVVALTVGASYSNFLAMGMDKDVALIFARDVLTETMKRGDHHE